MNQLENFREQLKDFGVKEWDVVEELFLIGVKISAIRHQNSIR